MVIRHRSVGCKWRIGETHASAHLSFCQHRCLCYHWGESELMKTIDMSGQAARRYFTIDEYHRMGEAGILNEHDRVELIEGEILRMSPIGSRHAACVNRLIRQRTNLIGDRAIVSPQNPIVLSDLSEPEPDVVILRSQADFYAKALPSATDALLIIEVADSSITYDREVKLPTYASSGIPEFWIVDLAAESIEVYTSPRHGVYQNLQSFQRGASITPLNFSDLAISVTSILG